MQLDALRLPFYSSSHPTGSHGWRNQFDLGNPDLGLFLSNVSYAQETGENQRSDAQGQGKPERREICNPEHRNSQAFLEAGCTGSFVSYRDSDIDRPEADGGDVVTQFISSQAPADLLIASVLIQTAGNCTFGSWGDNIHLSTGGSGNDVSVHGWWTDRSPPNCPPTADVEVWLQGLWCFNPPFNCGFVTLPSGAAHNEEEHTAGGGAGHRTNARHPCASNTNISFRALIDVDLVGVGDPSGYEIKEGDVLCYPE